MSCGAVGSASSAADAVRFPLLDFPNETRYSKLMTDSTTSYYIGDLCYVLPDVWSEVCSLVPYDNSEVRFQLEDGRVFFMMGTAHGDGVYSDQEGRTYGVDSGTIGAIRLEDIRDDEVDVDSLVALGNAQVVPIPEELEEDDVRYEDGTLTFGPVSISTGYEEVEEEEEDEDEDDEDA